MNEIKQIQETKTEEVIKTKSFKYLNYLNQ